MVSFRLTFPPKSYMRSCSPPACYMPCPSHPPWLNLVITRGEVYKLRSSSLCSFLQPITSSLFHPNMLLSTLFSNTLSLCRSLNVGDQVSFPHRTTGKIIVLYIIIFTFFRQQTRRQKVLGWLVASITQFNLLLTSSWINIYLVLFVFSSGPPPASRWTCFFVFFFLYCIYDIFQQICMNIHQQTDTCSYLCLWTRDPCIFLRTNK
jgi:hypothetical protein